jgi:hypothetical protein
VDLGEDGGSGNAFMLGISSNNRLNRDFSKGGDLRAIYEDKICGYLQGAIGSYHGEKTCLSYVKRFHLLSRGFSKSKTALRRGKF